MPSQQEEAERELKARLHQIPHPADRAMLRRAIKKVISSLTEAHKVEMEKMVEEERVRLLFLAQSVLKELNNSYSIDIKYADKKQWLEPDEFERIFLHRFNNAGIKALTPPTPEHLHRRV